MSEKVLEEVAPKRVKNLSINFADHVIKAATCVHEVRSKIHVRIFSFGKVPKERKLLPQAHLAIRSPVEPATPDHAAHSLAGGCLPRRKVKSGG